MAMEQDEILRTPAVWHPGDAREAWRLKEAFGPAGVYVAGGTLLRTQWEAGVAEPPAHLIDLTAIAGAGEVEMDGEEAALGALVPLSVCRSHPAILARYPLLAEAARVIAAPSVRNLATIGGNVVSRVGDALPALLALSAQLVWQAGPEPHACSLADWLERERRAPTPASGVLVQIRLPVPPDDTTSNAARFFAYHKVGRREAFMPSLVTVALTGRIGADGAVEEIRVAAGGGQTVPYRLDASEAALRGQTPDGKTLAAFQACVEEEYEPKPDLFATEAYRKRAAANLAAAAVWQAARDAAAGRKG
ncbi:FAD binding domain-containing protein [Cohnella nanjingensis]|uniref:FAD binding domain-containing protein n=1 Tax=Cohnella nanjingensis TaxID=1387779 RepID=A0A7X0VJD2_9BACL|nr:FAD binding domain-containing protein [Cohnella nanjingensis]MBB6675458.1 FAD binding domain-containing protein [Cohnella nanjingensis]